MKANEIRIGCNFQLENGVLGGGIATIKNKYDLDVAFDLLESNLIKPIPLTEEWLLKFNMEYVDGFSSQRKLYVKKHEYDISQITYSEKEGLIRLSNGEQKGIMLIPHIKYVHQLQNLYFALTGEELTFKSE